MEEAKDHARALSDLQTSAAKAVATISTHFRKKLNLWMRIEHMLEDAFVQARNDVGAGDSVGEKIEDTKTHMTANFARTDLHDQPTSSFSSSAPAYGSGTERTPSDRFSNAGPDADFTVTSGPVGPDTDGTVVFTSSNSAIEAFECTANSDCSAKYSYANTDNTDYSLHDRDSVCTNNRCVLPASDLGAGDTAKHTITVKEGSIVSSGDAGDDAGDAFPTCNGACTETQCIAAGSSVNGYCDSDISPPDADLYDDVNNLDSAYWAEATSLEGARDACAAEGRPLTMWHINNARFTCSYTQAECAGTWQDGAGNYVTCDLS